MPTKRQILEALTRDELLAVLDQYELEVADRRQKDDIVETLSGSGTADLSGSLASLPRKRLKELCRSLDLDDSGKEKAVILSRLLGTPLASTHERLAPAAETTSGGHQQAPEAVLQLVERFRLHVETYTSGQYNETQLRREFLDPFFKALGWDVDNQQGYAEAYKDVVHEDAIKVGQSTKAPDYSFRIGGTRKFFVEAKKPAVNIREDPGPAFQLRRYAWSANLPLSVLTNFDGLALYDCRTRPSPSDAALTSRIFYLHHSDYPTRWDTIDSVLGRESILRGAFDKFAVDTRSRRGTTEVDDEFLAEIERWRELLARNIALRNPALTQVDLNFAVQRIIDRIVFLRICEDRGIEDYGKLRTLSSGPQVYRKLCERFQAADARYNSGLFHFKTEKDRHESPDGLTLNLVIDDATLRDILSNLYYPESPYEFSVLPADILGHVYERFLGKVIRLTDGHRAQIDEKPEVRKAGGVYYTPTKIVQHIVRETVGSLLSGVSPTAAAKLRVLDPACGSGSFLLGAYQFILDWHRDWYLNDGPDKWARGKKPALFRGRRGDWKLTTAKRKDILLNNIFGVDLDSQAVEVTKLSLLLKVLEGETEETFNKTLQLFHERALPDLGDNIKCGNSLVGDDFGLSFVGAEDSMKAFSWQQAFPKVFEAGGFEAVIGNPPYLSYGGRQKVEIAEDLRNYFNTHYESAGWPTAHSFFLERSVKLLSKRFSSFIVPDQVGHLDGYESIRTILQREAGLRTVRYWGEHVFRGVTTPALTFTLDRTQRGPTEVTNIDGTTAKVALEPGEPWTFSASRTLLRKLADRSFSVRPYIADCGVRTTAAKKQVVPLAEAKGKFIPTLEGKVVGRYWCAPPLVAVLLDTPSSVFFGDKAKFERAAFVIRQTAAYPIVGPRRHTTYFRNSLHALFVPSDGPDVRYLVGLLNSKVLRFAYVEQIREARQQAFPQVKLGALAALPLRQVDLANSSDRRRHDEIVSLVAQMLSFHERREKERNPNSLDDLAQRIAATDAKIDAAVYALYDLSDDDVAAVERIVTDLPTPP